MKMVFSLFIIHLLFLQNVQAQSGVNIGEIFQNVKKQMDQLIEKINIAKNDPETARQLNEARRQIENDQLMIKLEVKRREEKIAPINCPDCTNLIELAGNMSNIISAFPDFRTKFEGQKLKAMYFLAKENMISKDISQCDLIYNPVQFEYDNNYYSQHDFKILATKDVTVQDLNGFAIENQTLGELYYYLAEDSEKNYYLIRIENREGKERVIFYQFRPNPILVAHPPKDPPPADLGIKIPWEEQAETSAQWGLWNNGDIFNAPIYFLKIQHAKTATAGQLEADANLSSKEIEVAFIFTKEIDQTSISIKTDYKHLNSDFSYKVALPKNPLSADILEFNYGNSFDLSQKNSTPSQRIGASMFSSANNVTYWINSIFDSEGSSIFQFGLNKKISNDIFLGAGFAVEKGKPSLFLNGTVTP